MLRRVVWEKFTDDSEVLAASIIRAIAPMMLLKSDEVSYHTLLQLVWCRNCHPQSVQLVAINIATGGSDDHRSVDLKR
jgi:hypothetical protein